MTIDPGALSNHTGEPLPQPDRSAEVAANTAASDAAHRAAQAAGAAQNLAEQRAAGLDAASLGALGATSSLDAIPRQGQ